MRRLTLAAVAAAFAVLLPTLARADDDLIKRGEYLTRAADCQACHTAAGGAAFAGGRPFTVPMGLLYSPNITPDQDTGIGRYSDAEWLRAIHGGVARGGKRLYPAMPYNSYTKMSDPDALAIKAYLFSLPAVHAPAPKNQMVFPFNHRILMIGWNLLNNRGARLQPDPGKSPEWNRGAYLVEALGHCAQCHTPRGLTFGLNNSRAFAGAVQQGWLAYNLTSDPQHGIGGWSDASLEHYLSTGHADGHGPASGPMAEAVQDSLHYMTPQDIHAIVVYLRGMPAQSDGPLVAAPGAALDTPSIASPDQSVALGGKIFAEACAGCHLPHGDGRQSQWASLRGSHSLGDPAGANMIQILANGSQLQTAQGLMFMHAFTRSYTDQELAAVSNYGIAQFGGRKGQVTPEMFAKARRAAAPGKTGSGS